MGRLTIHEPEALLEAAAALHASGGPRALTMTAVARAAGAPSGSVYHRFPSRGSLLSALWQNTAREFETAHRGVLGQTPTLDSALQATVWIVDWCRAEPSRAAVLHAGRHAFEPSSWPPEARKADEHAERERGRHLKDVAHTVAGRAGIPADEAAFALLGLPLAIVGPHLRAGRAVPAEATDLVRRVASRLLTSPVAAAASRAADRD